MRRPQDLLTSPEVAKILEISESAVWSKVYRGTLAYTALSARGDYLFDWAEVWRYRQQRRQRKKRPPAEEAARDDGSLSLESSTHKNLGFSPWKLRGFIPSRGNAFQALAKGVEKKVSL